MEQKKKTRTPGQRKAMSIVIAIPCCIIGIALAIWGIHVMFPSGSMYGALLLSLAAGLIWVSCYKVYEAFHPADSTAEAATETESSGTEE